MQPRWAEETSFKNFKALQNDTNVCLSFNNPHPANQIPEISIMKQNASMHQISPVHE